MRSIVLVLALVGCDRVFGLNERADPSADAASPIDASMPEVLAIDVPSAVGVGETVSLSATVSGNASSSVTCTFSANRGSVAANDVLVELDVNGRGMPSVEFTAPSSPGPATVRASLSGSEKSAVVDVRMSFVVGNDTTFQNGLSVQQAAILSGTRFVLGAPAYLRQVGLHASAVNTGTLAKIGVYDANKNLILATSAVTVKPGRNLFPLASSQPLPAGPFWMVTVFDRMTPIFGNSIAAGDGYLAHDAITFADPMPATLPSGSASGIGYSVFLVGI